MDTALPEGSEINNKVKGIIDRIEKE